MEYPTLRDGHIIKIIPIYLDFFFAEILPKFFLRIFVFDVVYFSIQPLKTQKRNRAISITLKNVFIALKIK